MTRATVLVLVATLLLGCTGDSAKRFGLNRTPEKGESRVNLDPVVIPRPKGEEHVPKALRDRRPVDKSSAGWDRKWKLAQDWAAGGFDAEALQVVDACIDMGPPELWAKRFRSLKSSLLLRRTEEALLRLEARPAKDYVVFGDDIDFELRLRNISPEVVRLLPPQSGTGRDGTSPNAMTVEVSRTDRDIYASRMQRRWSQNFFLQRAGAGAIEIEPGAVHRIPLRIPAADLGAPVAGIRVVEVGGMLRPTRLRRGKQARTVRLRIRSGRVVVLPPGYEPLVQEPLEGMRKAIDTVAPTHLLIATEFLNRRQAVAGVRLLARALAVGAPALRRAALGALELVREHNVGASLRPMVEPLMERLEGEAGYRDEAVMEGIAALADVRLAPDVRLWRDWWQQGALEGARVPPVDREAAPTGGPAERMTGGPGAGS